MSGAETLELAVHFGMELYSMDAEKMQEYVEWKVEQLEKVKEAK